MNPIYSQVCLDLQHKAIEPVNLKQYDYEARAILFRITDNGNPYILTDDMLAEVKIHKPDGTKIVARGGIHVGSNEITVKVSRQMTAVYGVLCADVTLFREDRLLSTMPFHLHVEKSPVQNEDIDSVDEYTLWEDLIAEAQKNEMLRQANEQARVLEEQERSRREAAQRERIDNALSDTRAVTRDAAATAADLQDKLDSHHFVLTEDKYTAGGVAALDTNGKIPYEELYEATTSRRGVTQLTDSVTSNSTTTAATPNSVKTVYDAVVKVNSLKHTHGNKSVLDGITADAVGQWNAAAGRADTWRGIQDNLTSTSAVDSLSANQGRVLKELIDSKTSTPSTVPWSGVTGKPGSYPPSSHTHDDRYYTETEVNNLLGSKASSSHTHDNRYYTETEINSLLGGKANSSHTHSKSDVGLGNVDNTADVNKSVASAQYAVQLSKNPVITIGSEAHMFNGAGNVSFSVEGIGAAPKEHSHGYLPLAGGTVTGTLAIPILCHLKYGNWGLYSENNQMLKFQPKESEYTLSLGVTDVMWALAPWKDGAYQLGTPNHKWGNIYAHGGTIQTSDRNQKQDITLVSDKYLAFFSLLQPVTYRFIDGTSGRIHVGFISQDVEDAMAQCGLSELDFAGFCRDKKRRAVQCRRSRQKLDDAGSPLTDENGDPVTEEYEDIIYEDELDSDGNPIYIYSLRYEEFIALNTAVIQRQQTKIASLEQRLERLEAKSNSI